MHSPLISTATMADVEGAPTGALYGTDLSPKFDAVDIGGGDGSFDGGLRVEDAEWKRLATVLGAFGVVILALFGLCVEYSPVAFEKSDAIQYMFYLHVTVMMLVGFGFLMTFMRKFKLGAVGLTFLITALCIPWCILTGRFFASVARNADYGQLVAPGAAQAADPAATLGTGPGTWWPRVSLDINSMLQGNFAAAAVLISFGALIGKLTPAQTALLAILEVPLYSFNKEVLAIGLCGTLDMGGTIFIHLFGAYFGLAAAWVVGRPRAGEAEGAEPSHVSDVLSLLGTVFLWLYWPSFNGATAPLGQNQQLLTTANTVLALCASCLTTFVVSALLNKRLSTVDIQNATLAGGVAVGASSNLAITPFFAMLIGVVAATVSTVGFNKLQPVVERLGVHDSCGVHNLHGMPAVIGSLAVAIATTIPATHAFAGAQPFPRGDAQWAGQLEGALLTLVTAVLGGLAVGWIVKKVLPNGHTQFTDAPFWTVADNFKKMD